jgi:hypothetical protein
MQQPSVVKGMDIEDMDTELSEMFPELVHDGHQTQPPHTPVPAVPGPAAPYVITGRTASSNSEAAAKYSSQLQDSDDKNDSNATHHKSSIHHKAKTLTRMMSMRSTMDDSVSEQGRVAQLTSKFNNWPRTRAMINMRTYFDQHAATHAMLHGINPAEQKEVLEILNDPERAANAG